MFSSDKHFGPYKVLLHRVLFYLSQMNRLFALVLGILFAIGITMITVYTGYIPANVNIVSAKEYEATR